MKLQNRENPEIIADLFDDWYLSESVQKPNVQSILEIWSRSVGKREM